jgi:DNA-binding transcriptional regulator YiaG
VTKPETSDFMSSRFPLPTDYTMRMSSSFKAKEESEMTDRKMFSALRDEMSPEDLAEIVVRADALRVEMDLAELRRARKLSQEQLASILEVSQGSVAKMEKRTDMYISSLRRVIEAMGGQLEITARFSNHSVCISKFSDLDNASV